MSEPTVPDNDRQRRLEEAMAEYLIAADTGRPPESETFLGRYPDLRADLAEFLADRSALAKMVEPLLSAAALPEPRATPEPVATLPLSAVTTEVGAPTGDPVVGLDSAVANETTDDPVATAKFDEGPPGGEATGTLPGGIRVRYFGDYELFKVLGRGGMGVVYKARQLSLDRPVALKMLQAGILAAEDDLRRFQNEAEAVALLDHPNIVPILEVGQYEAQRYFSMKLIVGPSLDRKLGEYTANPKAVARLIRTLAEAVNHAHRRGILHRDLKPGNILLDERGEPHVTDFGLAKRVHADRELTQSGAILGTPAYMAPEQASGQRGIVTIASDIYGLGAILYALLTGRAPFSGNSPLETLEQVRTRMPEPPRRANPRVPSDLEVITMKCLEKDPMRRYASAQALGEDLGRYLMGEPIHARPVGLPARAWMWCKRKPVLAGLASALTLALLIALFCGIGVAVVERGQRREADARKRAEMSFNMAQQTVEDYMTSVSENTLLKEQDSLDSRGLRRELLEDALKYYQRFVRERSGDPLVRRELAKAYFRIGQITQEIGSPKEAFAAYVSSQAIWEALDKADSDDRDAAGRRADCSLAIGRLQNRTDNLLGALETLNHARGLLESLTARYPNVVAFQATLAACLSELGVVVIRLESPGKGLPLLKRAREIQQRLTERYPQEARYRVDLAEIIGVQGYISQRKPDNDEALRSFQQVRDIFQRLLDRVGAGPKPIRYLNWLAQSHYNIANNLMGQRRVDEALKSYEESLKYRTALVQGHPSVPRFRENLATSYSSLAMAQLEAQQEGKAIESLKETWKILGGLVDSQPDHAGYHSQLRRCMNMMRNLHDGTITDKRFETVKAGDLAPDLTVRRIGTGGHGDVTELQLSDHQGQLVLVNFWATWCEPCLAEMPALKDIQAAFGDDRRFVLIGLSCDQTPELVKDYLRKNPLPWTQGFAGNLGSGVGDRYLVHALPATFLIGPDGRILAKNLRGTALKETIAKALDDKALFHAKAWVSPPPRFPVTRFEGTASANAPGPGAADRPLVVVLDDSDEDFRENRPHRDALRILRATDGGLGGAATSSRFPEYNTCQTIGGVHGIAIDRERGRIYLCELVANRVTALDFHGRRLWQVDRIDGDSLAVDPRTGNLWCTVGKDLAAGETVVLDPTGREVASLPGRGVDIAYDPHTDAFWLAGYQSNGITKLSREGQELFRKPCEGFAFVSVAADPRDGSVWVVERAHSDLAQSANRVWHLNSAGGVIKTWPLGEKQIFGIACDPKTGTAWVACPGSEILPFTADGRALPPLPIKAVAVAASPTTGQFWATTETEIIGLDAEGRPAIRSPLEPKSLQSWLAAY